MPVLQSLQLVLKQFKTIVRLGVDEKRKHYIKALYLLFSPSTDRSQKKTRIKIYSSQTRLSTDPIPDRIPKKLRSKNNKSGPPEPERSRIVRTIFRAYPENQAVNTNKTLCVKTTLIPGAEMVPDRLHNKYLGKNNTGSRSRTVPDRLHKQYCVQNDTGSRSQTTVPDRLHKKYSVQATPAPGAKQRSRTVTSGCLVQNGIGSRSQTVPDRLYNKYLVQKRHRLPEPNSPRPLHKGKNNLAQNPTRLPEPNKQTVPDRSQMNIYSNKNTGSQSRTVPDRLHK